jgi:hypothetical protein
LKPAAAVAGFIFLCAASGLADTPNAPSNAPQSRKPARSAAQGKTDAPPATDFDGLEYTEEQKSELSKIHQDTEAHKAAVVKSETLSEDQKNAMLLGYTRMEYGRTFKVLSPAQQKRVRQRVLARKAADKPKPIHKPQAPLN